MPRVHASNRPTTEGSAPERPAAEPRAGEAFRADLSTEPVARDPFATPLDAAFALSASPPRPVETGSIRVFRRLFLVAGNAGMAAIVTVTSIIVSVLVTAVTQSLVGFEGWYYWTGILVAIFVPLVVAPLVSFQFSQLTEYLLGLEAQLQSLARRDALTGAPNRRWITERCDEAAAFAAATGRGYGVLMVDVDHFKSINDRFGHHGGDAVLRDVVRTLAAGLRPTDRFGRYGGEEFLVLTNDASADTLLARAEALRRAIAGTPVRLDGVTIEVTASVGAALVAGFHPANAAEDALRRADAALYRAKSDGRNRVAFDDGSAPAGLDARRGTDACRPVFATTA